MSTTPPSLAALRAAVDEALAGYLDEALPRLPALHGSLAPLADELRAFVLDGGKRIRPALLLVGYQAAGGDELDRVLGPAMALELLHTCALLHDDIIDAAGTRRGRETTHLRFAREHREAGWAGDSDLHGAGVAILLGDLAFVQADEVFLRADVADDRLLRAFRRFTLLREEVMAGQYIDLYAAASRTTSRELALTVATMKSGRYSVARPLEIGALLAGADASLVRGLSEVGGPLGRAFQVRDDVLGVFGEEDVTGKSAAGDLVEGKRTLLVAETAARLGDADRTRLEAALGDPALTPEEAETVRHLMRTSGGLAATEAYVADAVAEARAALARLEVTDRGRAALEEMASFLAQRDA